MSKSKRYPQEIRERSVALVLEHQGEHPSQWACIRSIATKAGMTPETLSRILASLRAQGTVTVKGPAITILDDEALRSVAAGKRLTAHDAG